MPQLPNRECSECPEGNAFMTHIRTETQPSPEARPDHEYDHIAIFRCGTCGHVTRDAFDPDAL